MDIEQAKSVLSKTHLGAITRGERATTYILVGKSGTAKSEGVYQAAANMSILLDEPFGLVTKMAASWQSVDFGGFGIPKNVKGYEWPLMLFTAPPWKPNRFNTTVFMPDHRTVEPPLPEDLEIPRFGWLFLDEWGLLDPDLQKAGAPLLLSGGIGDHYLDLGWRVVCASNRLIDKTGVEKPLTLVQNRMGTLEIEARFPSWNKWVDNLPRDKRPHHLTIGFAEKNPHIVFSNDAPPGDGEPFCTGRSLVKMDKDTLALRTDDEVGSNKIPVDQISKQVCTGLIGAPAASQYYTHCKYEEKIPTYKQVVANPRECRLPIEKDAQMVAVLGMAHQLEEDHVDRVQTYIERMSKEMQVLYMRKCRSHVEKGAWMSISDRVTRWMMENADLLVASSG